MDMRIQDMAVGGMAEMYSMVHSQSKLLINATKIKLINDKEKNTLVKERYVFLVVLLYLYDAGSPPSLSSYKGSNLVSGHYLFHKRGMFGSEYQVVDIG
jgi:hypothetical protein